jgi:integrase/recombinase XerC
MALDWDAALAAFRAYLAVERNYSPRTVDVYLRDVTALRAFLRKHDKDVALDRLSALHVRAQLAALFGHNGAATIARKLSSVRAFTRFLVRKGELDANPAAAIRGPKRRRGLPRALDVDDAKQLVESPTRRHQHVKLAAPLQLRDACLLELLYGTGLRVSEACALDLADIDRSRYATAMVVVRRGKGGKSRQVPLGGAADRALAAWLDARAALAPATPALFVNPAGTRLTPRSVQRAVRRWRVAGNITAPVTPHVLRHSFATHLLDAHVDLRAIQELLGHASLGSTQIYTQVSLEHLQAVYDDAHPRARKP